MAHVNIHQNSCTSSLTNVLSKRYFISLSRQIRYELHGRLISEGETTTVDEELSLPQRSTLKHTFMLNIASVKSRANVHTGNLAVQIYTPPNVLADAL